MIANGVRDAKIIQQGNYPSTDKIFNDSYGKQGLQPRGIGGDPAEDNSAQNGVRSVKKETRQGILPTETKSVNQAPQPSPLGNTLNIATKNLALKTLVTAVNNSAVAWSGSLWLFLQLPLALMFIATLGIVGFIQGVADSNIILGAVAWAVNAVTAAAAALVGIDANISDLANSYMLILYVMIIAIGFFSLFIAFLQYTLASLNPLDGDKAGLKKGVFILCLFGYSAPVLNLFPWILLWLAVIWKYPR